MARSRVAPCRAEDNPGRNGLVGVSASAPYPSVTFELMGTILTSGTCTQAGDVWYVDWTTVVSGTTTLCRLVVRDGVIHLVIVGPEATIPFFVTTAFKAGTTVRGVYNPNPTILEQWLGVMSLVCNNDQYPLHLFRQDRRSPQQAL